MGASTTATDRGEPADRRESIVSLKLVFEKVALSAPRSFVVGPTGRILGREPDLPDGQCVRLHEDLKASRRHAQIGVDGKGAWVRDQGSKNGTYVNGARVTKARLADGDLLRIGGALFVVRVHEDSVSTAPPAPFSAHAPNMERLLGRAAQLAGKLDNFLLLGETGVGKEVMAQYLHARSRCSGLFVAVNCAAIPAELFESALFGHRRGAFSGAVQDQEGFLKKAHLGTLFLDEVGELPLLLQPKLLRALQMREFSAVGTTALINFSATVIAATNRDFASAVRAGHYRADLLARLSGVTFNIPPLRERKEDILPILMERLSPSQHLSASVAEALLLYRWPLNIRELVNLGKYLRARCSEEKTIDLCDVKEYLSELASSASGGALDSDGAAVAAEPASQGALISRAELERELKTHHGNVARIAAKVDRSPRQIRRWMEQFGLRRKDYLPD